jgi:hypothetical protein
MAFLRNILFCLSDVLLQRYDFTQLAVVHCDPGRSHVWLMVECGVRTSICGMAED